MNIKNICIYILVGLTACSTQKTGNQVPDSGIYAKGETGECLCIDFEKMQMVSVSELQMAPPIGARILEVADYGYTVKYSPNFTRVFPELSKNYNIEIYHDRDGTLSIRSYSNSDELVSLTTDTSQCEMMYGPDEDPSFENICEFKNPSVDELQQNKEAILQYLNP